MTEHRVRAGYDTVAATYADQFCDITPRGVVADIGCGPSHITRFLAARLERVVGLDLSPAMIAAARQAIRAFRPP